MTWLAASYKLFDASRIASWNWSWDIYYGPDGRARVHNNMYLAYYTSDAASRWAGWTLAQPEIGSSVNPITTRGADYAHHITASPPRFENPAASLYTAI